MTDREFLELAAKAAGIEYRYGYYVEVDERVKEWNPLDDDGDALRLAVDLRLEVYIHEEDTRVIDGNLIAGVVAGHDGDPYAATRRAIVRAAAAIGEAMP